MKKTILILGLIITIPANATTMCAINDTVAVVLDPTIADKNSGYDNTAGTWWTQFPYGRVSGISACIDTKWGKSMGGTVPKMTDSNGNRVTGSEKNGQYCWCKMTHPAASLWAFNYDYGSAASCASSCTLYCGNYVQVREALRFGLFGSVAQ